MSKLYIMCAFMLHAYSFDFTEIQNCDLNQGHATQQYLINEAGKYKIIEDLTSKPTNANISCIKITASNISIDFNGFSLTQQSSTSSGLTAIEIAANVSNIDLYNIEIGSIDGNGIKIGAGANNITINGGSISSCKKIGMDIDQACELDVYNVNVNQYDGSHSGALNGAVGIKLNKCVSCRFTNVYCNKGSQTGSKETCAWLLQSCNNCLFADCKAIANESKKSTVGFYITTSLNNHFKSCKVEGTIAKEDAYGFRLDETNKYNLFENCECSYSNSSTGSAYGFYCKNGNGNCFKDCVAMGNSGANSSGKEGSGFYLTGETNSFIVGCTIKANNAKTGHGIHSVSATYCTIEDNKIFGNTGTDNGYGLRDDAASSTNFILKNFAYANQDSTTNKKVNNYHAKLSPDDSLSIFPVVSVFLNNYSRASKATTLDNIEAIERPDGCNE